MPIPFRVGEDRLISLWGGRGARQVHHWEFPGLILDNRTYDMVYTEEGVERVRAMGFNQVHLMCSWGFPPEIEESDWEVFRRAVRLYHGAGIKVVGGVMVSNAVFQGSYRDKTWYALDAWGKPIPYHTGRLYTCWDATDWLAEVENRIRVVVEAGAEGVLLRAAWPGGVPVLVGRGLTGGAGCHDPRCQAAYMEAGGSLPAPKGLNLRDARVRQYLQWRADLVAGRIREWAGFARELNPDLAVIVEGCEPAAHSTLILCGHARGSGSAGQDGLLVAGTMLQIESGQGPAPHVMGLGIALSGGEKRSVLSHIVSKTPNADTTWPERRLGVAMGEVCALGAMPVVHGDGYVYRRNLTLLTHTQFARQQQVVTRMNHWLADHAPWLGERTNASPLAVYWPGDALEANRDAADAVFWGAGATLVQHGLPFRVVGEGDWEGVRTLIVPPGQAEGVDERLRQFADGGGRVIALQRSRAGSTGRPLWTGYHAPRSSWVHWPGVRRLTNRLSVTGTRLYYRRAAVRLLVNQVRRYRGEPDVPGWPAPSPEMQTELIDAIGSDFKPRAEAKGPLLFTMWREPGGVEQWHVVNYRDEPQRVTLQGVSFVSGWVYAPEMAEAVRVFGTGLIVTVNEYKVLRLFPELPRQ